MKIILIGGAGTLGGAVDKALKVRHEIVRVGRKSGDFQVDITDPASIEQLFKDRRIRRRGERGGRSSLWPACRVHAGQIPDWLTQQADGPGEPCRIWPETYPQRWIVHVDHRANQ
jgi:RmlD substrate binding domain